VEIKKNKSNNGAGGSRGKVYIGIVEAHEKPVGQRKPQKHSVLSITTHGFF